MMPITAAQMIGVGIKPPYGSVFLIDIHSASRNFVQNMCGEKVDHGGVRLIIRSAGSNADANYRS